MITNIDQCRAIYREIVQLHTELVDTGAASDELLRLKRLELHYLEKEPPELQSFFNVGLGISKSGLEEPTIPQSLQLSVAEVDWWLKFLKDRRIEKGQPLPAKFREEHGFRGRE